MRTAYGYSRRLKGKPSALFPGGARLCCLWARRSKPSTLKSESRAYNPAFHFGSIVSRFEIQCMTARTLLRYSVTPRP